MLVKLLRSKAAVKILGVVLFRNGMHLRDISRTAGISASEAKRELDLLHSIGLLKKEKRGNQVIFSKNESCTFFSDLKALYQKTEGVFMQLKDELSGRSDISFAFIFGSSATGQEKPHSDIDLMVIGEIREKDLAEVIFHIQKNTGHEINYILWSKEALKGKIKSPFLKNILEKETVWIVGDKGGFSRIVGSNFS